MRHGMDETKAATEEGPHHCMQPTRRKFLNGTATAGVLSATHSLAMAKNQVKAIAFDAFAVLDPRPIARLAEEVFPGKGSDLTNAWRIRQFEYSWLRTLTRHYVDFWQVTGEALLFAAGALHLGLTNEKRDRLMNGYMSIQCWPEVPAALRALKDRGLRLALLSNMTEKMLTAGVRNSGLEGVFEHVLSTDRVRVYKPDPGAYQMGEDAFALQRQELVFAAFAGWDAAGAKAFGYPTYWVNRQNQPAERLGFFADAAGETLADLARHIENVNS